MVSLLPLGVLAGGAILVLLAAAFLRRLAASFVLTLAVTVTALVLAALQWNQAPFTVGAMLSFDRFVLFGIVLILAATLFAAASSWSFLRHRGQDNGGYFFLLVVATLGGCVLAASSAFATFFLGLELLSVALYALIGWRREHAAGTEAAIRYLILAGASSAFLLFGMALVYAETGTMSLFHIAESAFGGGIISQVGVGMMLVGIGFKLAVVPFHMWTPDVYDGAPSPVTGYIASVSKGAMVVVLARAFAPALTGYPAGAGTPISAVFPWVITVIAAVSMFAGNILALRENRVKRILAYSSIAHLGYLLVAFLAAGAEGLRAIAFYLVAYFAAILGAFAAVGEAGGDTRDVDRVSDYEGLAARRPGLAFVMTAMILSLAGLPLTAGFIGKFLLLRAGAGAQLWTLAVILAVNGTISVFYYLKIISAVFRGFMKHGHDEPVPAAAAASAAHNAGAAARIPLVAGLGLAVLALVVVILGVYPSPLLGFIGSFTGTP
jgi:NADH-quinone oxidoreductase subunit N